MFTMNMYSIITKPTRITAHSAMLVDNIFTNVLDNNTISGLLLSDTSDHFPIFMMYGSAVKQVKMETLSVTRGL